MTANNEANAQTFVHFPWLKCGGRAVVARGEISRRVVTFSDSADWGSKEAQNHQSSIVLGCKYRVNSAMPSYS